MRPCKGADWRWKDIEQYKPRDKITQKMTRDGLTEQNQTTGESERISKRIQEADFQKTPEQQAAQDAAQLQGAASPPSPLPHTPGTAPKQDTAAAERVMEHTPDYGTGEAADYDEGQEDAENEE